MNRGQVKLNFHALRKGTETPEICLRRSPIVIKTIRLRRETLEPWINSVDFKVVHLVRDPRYDDMYSGLCLIETPRDLVRGAPKTSVLYYLTLFCDTGPLK